MNAQRLTIFWWIWNITLGLMGGLSGLIFGKLFGMAALAATLGHALGCTVTVFYLEQLQQAKQEDCEQEEKRESKPTAFHKV